MPYLIDGSNLIGHIPNLELRDSQSKYRLVAQLVLFQAIKKTKIILVFDGPPEPELMEKNLHKKDFIIHWPNQGESADTLISQWIQKQTDLRHLFVVSSDREIKIFARLSGAKTLDSKDFYKLLKAILKEYKESQAMDKKDTSLSPLELEHWMEIFGASDE